MIATQFVVAMETGHDAQAQVRLHNHAAGRWVREYIPENKKIEKKYKKLKNIIIVLTLYLTGHVEVVSTCSRQPKLITFWKKYSSNNNDIVPFLHVLTENKHKHKHSTLLVNTTKNFI